MSEEIEQVTAKIDGDSSGIVKAFDQATSGAKKLADMAGTIYGAYSKGQAVVEGFSKKLLKISAGSSATIGGLGFTAAKLETQIANVSTVADSTQSSISSMTQAVLRMQTEVPKGATEIANALYDVESSGFHGAEALDLVATSSQAATAGLTDVQTAAGATSAILLAYGKSGAEAAAVSDTLFQTVNLGRLTFEQLAMTVGDWAAMAATLHVPLEDATSALAAMTLAGTNANESSTQLTRLMQSFINPSQAMTKAFQDQGYASADLALRQLGLKGSIDLLTTAAKGNPATLQDMFVSIEALNGVMQLGSANGKNYEKAISGIADPTARAGATMKAMDKQAATLAFQIGILKNTFSSIAISIGNSMLPALKFGTHILVIFATGVLDMINAVRSAFSIFGPFSGAIKGVAGALFFTLPALTGFMGLMLKFNAVKVFGWGLTVISKIFPQIGVGIAAVQARWAAWMLQMQASGTVSSTFFGKIMSGLGGVKNAAGKAMGAFVILSYIMGAYSTSARHAQQAADALADSFRNQIKTNDLDSYKRALEGVQKKIIELQPAARLSSDKIKGLGKVFGTATGWKDVIQRLEPFGLLDDTVVNATEGVKRLSEEQTQMVEDMRRVSTNAELAAKSLGLTTNQVYALAAAGNIDLAKIDPKDQLQMEVLFATLGKVTTESKRTMTTQDKLTDAIAVFGDVTKNASDRVTAYKAALDALLGTNNNLADAQASAGSAVRGLVETLNEIGFQNNAWTEKGAELQASLSNTTQAVMGLAQAQYESTKDIASANQVLTDYSDYVREAGRSAGLTEAEIQDLIKRMNLTPDDLSVLVKLNDADISKEKIANMGDDISKGLSTEATPTLNTSVINSQIAEVKSNFAKAFELQDKKFTPEEVDSVAAYLKETDKNTFKKGAEIAMTDVKKKTSLPPVKSVLEADTPKKRENEDALAKIGKIGFEQYKDILQKRLAAAKQGSSEWANIYGQLQDMTQSHENAMYEAGKLGFEKYRAVLQKRLAGAEVGSDAWLAAYTQIESLEKGFQDNMYSIGRIGYDQYKAILQKRLASFQQGTAEWTAVYQQLQEMTKTHEDDMYSIGQIGYQDYMNILRKRLAAAQQGSGEWVSIYKQMASAQRDHEDTLYGLGQVSTDSYIKMLQNRMAALRKFSDEWYTVQGEITQIQIEQADKRYSHELIDTKTYAQLLNGKLNTVVKFSDQWYGINDKISGAVDKFKAPLLDSLNLTDKFKSVVDQFNNSIHKAGERATLGVEDIRAYFDQWKNSVGEWQKTVKLLSASKIDRSIIESVVAGGPSNAPLATALLKMDPKEVNTNKEYFTTAANNVVKDVTGVNGDYAARGGVTTKTTPVATQPAGGSYQNLLKVDKIEMAFTGTGDMTVTKQDVEKVVTFALDGLAVKLLKGAQG